MMDKHINVNNKIIATTDETGIAENWMAIEEITREKQTG
jgi:hypothetical protein